MTALCEERQQNKKRSDPNEKANQSNKANSERAAVTTKGQPATTTLRATNKQDNEIYLQTAKAILCDNNNCEKICTRIIMDNGSQRTYINEKVADEFKLTVVVEEMSKILTFGEAPNKEMKLVKKGEGKRA